MEHKERRRYPLQQKKTGLNETELYVLMGLQIGPTYGFQLQKRIQDLSGGTINVSVSNIYPCLQDLTERELTRLMQPNIASIFGVLPTTEAGPDTVNTERLNLAPESSTKSRPASRKTYAITDAGTGLLKAEQIKYNRIAKMLQSALGS